MIAVVLTAAVGVLLPPGLVSTGLMPPGVSDQDLRTGVWLLKGVLILLAVLGVLTARSPAVGEVGDPLMNSGLANDTAPRRLEWIAVFALLAVAAGLRIWGLGQGLWYDEIETLVEYARRPLVEIATSYTSQNNHMLYSLAASASTAMFGESAWSLRLPAAALGVASIWAVYLFGTAVTRRQEAFLAAMFLTFSYHHVWFSQNARGYTGLLLWTMLGTLAFLRLLSSTRVGWGLVLGYGIAMALAAFTHMTAVLTVAAHGLIWVVLVWSRRGSAMNSAPWPALAGLAWATGLTLLLYAVVLPQLVTTLFTSAGTGGTTDWQSPVWMVIESVRGLQRGLPGGLLTIAVGVTVVGAGTLAYWRQSRVVTALMLLPAMITIAVAVGLSHNLWPRFFFFSAGFGALIVVRGVYRLMGLVLQRHATTWATAVMLLVIAASGATVAKAWAPKQDYVAATSYVERESLPGDTVVLVDLTRYPIQRYLERPWEAVDDLDGLQAIEATSDRTWLLYTFPIRFAAIEPDLWARVQQAYDTAAVFPGTVGDGAIFVMVTP